MRIVLGRPRNFWQDRSPEFAEHRDVYARIIQVLTESNHEFAVYEHRPGRERLMPKAPGDGPRYIYHAEEPQAGDYSLKRGPLPYLWYFDTHGYSGWSAIARDEALQARSMEFDAARSATILAAYRAKLENENYALIPQLDARTEPEIDELESFIFYPLQVNNDEVMKLAHCPQFELIRKAGEQAEKLGRHLVIKRHPLCVSGTVADAIDAVIDSDFVHVSTGPTVPLIERSTAVMLTNSSVGVQALVLDTPVFAFGGSEYAHLTTQLAAPGDVERVFRDTPPPPHSAYAGGIAYLLSDYLVDVSDPECIAARIEAHLEECRSQSIPADGPDDLPASEEDLRALSLGRVIERESRELLDFVLMTYGDLAGDAKIRVARMLARLARSGIFTERIIAQTDADVSNRCISYLQKNPDMDVLVRVTRTRLKARPHDWRASYALAKARYALDDAKSGLEAARQAAQSAEAPVSVRLYFARRMINGHQWSDDAVRQIVDSVLDAEPQNAVANWLQSRIAFLEGNLAAARDHIDAALDVQPDNGSYLALRDKIVETQTLDAKGRSKP